MVGAMRITQAGSGVRVAKDLGWLRPVLRSWIGLIGRYGQVMRGDGDDGDAAYWHAETTNVALLSAAAWVAGLVSLNEYPSEKTKKLRETGYGRTDLFISGPRRASPCAVIEGKQCFPIHAVTDIGALLDRSLAEALDDARNSDTSCDLRLGAVFVTLKADPHLSGREVEGCVRDLLRTIHSRGPDAMAWAFPAIDRPKRTEERGPPHRTFQWPGVALMMKVAAGGAG